MFRLNQIDFDYKSNSESKLENIPVSTTYTSNTGKNVVFSSSPVIATTLTTNVDTSEDKYPKVLLNDINELSFSTSFDNKSNDLIETNTNEMIQDEINNDTSNKVETHLLSKHHFTNNFDDNQTIKTDISKHCESLTNSMNILGQIPPPIHYGPNNRRIVTHYLDGFVIYESNKPFPVSRMYYMCKCSFFKKIHN